MANYGNLDDETLVNLSLIGEDGAFDELMARYEDAVLEKAEQIVGNPFSAEDIAQDTFFSRCSQRRDTGSIRESTQP